MGAHIENNNLKKIREELGKTQEEFANILNMSESGYGKLERGVVSLSMDKVYAIKKEYGLSADYILFDDKSELDDVWTTVFRLPEQEKINLFLRMYAYYSGILGTENMIDKCMKLADNIENDLAIRQDGED